MGEAKNFSLAINFVSVSRGLGERINKLLMRGHFNYIDAAFRKIIWKGTLKDNMIEDFNEESREIIFNPSYQLIYGLLRRSMRAEQEGTKIFQWIESPFISSRWCVGDGSSMNEKQARRYEESKVMNCSFSLKMRKRAREKGEQIKIFMAG